MGPGSNTLDQLPLGQRVKVNSNYRNSGSSNNSNNNIIWQLSIMWASINNQNWASTQIRFEPQS